MKASLIIGLIGLWIFSLSAQNRAASHFLPKENPDSLHILCIKAYAGKAAELHSIAHKLAAINILPGDPIERLGVLNILESGRELKSLLAPCFHEHCTSCIDSMGLKPVWEDVKTHIDRLDLILRESQWELHQGYYQRGIKALQACDTSAATEAFLKSRSAKPGFAPSALALIRIYLNRQQLREATHLALAYHMVHDDSTKSPLSTELPAYIHLIKHVQQNEEHTLALEHIDSLLIIFDTDTLSLFKLRELQHVSRMAIVQAYLNVSNRAAESGNRMLSAHYETMAGTQAHHWNIELPAKSTSLGEPEIARIEDVKQSQLVKNQKAIPIRFPQSMSKRSAAYTSITQSDTEEMLASSERVAFLAWQGDTMAAQIFIQKIDSLMTRGIDRGKLMDAKLKVENEVASYRCRQQMGAVEAALLASEKWKSAGKWGAALASFQQAGSIWDGMEKCQDKIRTSLTIPSLLLHAASYEASIKRARELIDANQFQQADSLINQANAMHKRDIGSNRGPAMVSWKEIIHPEKDIAFIVYKAARSTLHADLKEALWCLETLRAAHVNREDVAPIQRELGHKLAERDLQNTRLSNPKTLLVQHIPLIPWYKPLSQAYHKRFRKG